MYLIENGAAGLAVLVTVWQLIYINEGYFIRDDDDLKLLVKKRINADVNEITDCINTCLRRNIFDEGIRKKYGVLTSKGIQRRFFDAAKKKKIVNAEEKFLLINVEGYKNIVFGDENSINEGGNATKEKEDVKEKVEEKGKRQKLKTSIPENFDISKRISKWAEKNGFTNNLEKHLESFILKAKAKGYQYVDWDSAFMNAVRDDWAGLNQRSATVTSHPSYQDFPQ
jgi:hypothetical protein